MDATLIKALINSALYPHKTKKLDIIETHLSWIILTGFYAYKIKKPINLGFQDFTTLEKRKHFCELEISLNKRLAPQLYIGVIPITGKMSEPQLDGQGPIIEYAIKMHQFNQNSLLSTLAKKKRLSQRMIKNIATQLAHFHQAAEIANGDSPYGTLPQILHPVNDNFSALLGMPFSEPFYTLLQGIQQWTTAQSEIHSSLLNQRKQDGFIRACHGDVHLGNIALVNKSPIIFDCIEFNEDFRWIDTISDTSFLFMDLIHKGFRPLAFTYINQYLENSGDYKGLLLLPFYACYRAMVRAKVTGFAMMQVKTQSLEYQQLKQEFSKFITLASAFSQPPAPSLSITMGISGSGKSVYTEKLLAQQGAIRLRSDVIRKQYFNLPLYEQTPDYQKPSVYSEEVSKKVFQQLRNYAKQYLSHHYPVIIDATCIKYWQRELFFSLANELNVPFQILAFDANLADIAPRLEKRQKMKQVSDANLSVAQSQLKNVDLLTEKERNFTTFITKDDIATFIRN